MPAYVLRVPVQYYRRPPPYFRAWRPDAPPRWGEHWGKDWQQRRPDWDRWDRRSAPPPAPLPTYQLKYPQSRYPQDWERQQSIRSEHYRYQPREPVVRQAYRMNEPSGRGPDRSADDRGRKGGDNQGGGNKGGDSKGGGGKGNDKQGQGGNKHGG